MTVHQISDERLDLRTVESILLSGMKLELSPESRERISKCREFLEGKLEESNAPVYGINTGFGALYNKSIAKKDLTKLQHNLVVSHAAGTGEEVPAEVVRLMLLLKIQGLSYGHSGIRVETIERLIDLYNNDILPVVYEQGSLGASGDLSPLAHLSLPLIGLGEVYYKGQQKTSAEVLESFGWQPLELQPKEGLAMLNGTQFMSAYGISCLLHAWRLSGLADLIGAMSLDAFDCRPEPFDILVHQVRPHLGQLETAKTIRELLEGSELISRDKEHVQDPYSFRCMPQVHGASKEMLEYVTDVFETEINSVTDNPTLFPDDGKILSAGNFHGQPLAIALDCLCIALAELGSISERRTYKLLSGQRGLPEFLVSDPGINSGLMITQYTAASIVSQNKQFCTPASVDTIDSSNGQEDHVSMGANAATKCLRVVNNLEKILAIELMNAAQALEFRRPSRSSEKIENFMAGYRKSVSFIESDRLLHDDILNSIDFIRIAV